MFKYNKVLFIYVILNIIYSCIILYCIERYIDLPVTGTYNVYYARLILYDGHFVNIIK